MIGYDRRLKTSCELRKVRGKKRSHGGATSFLQLALRTVLASRLPASRAKCPRLSNTDKNWPLICFWTPCRLPFVTNSTHTVDPGRKVLAILPFPVDCRVCQLKKLGPHEDHFLPTNAPAARGRSALNVAADPTGLSDLPKSLPEALRWAAQNHRASTILHVDASGREKRQSFADLLGEAAGVCGSLAALGLKNGDSAILLLENSTELLPAFWGCLLAGVRPAIAQIPPTFVGESRSLHQLGDVWRLLDRPLVICNSDVIESVRLPSSSAGVDRVRMR